MGISVGGIGSGLDVNSLVSQLVAAEGAPKRNLLNSRQSSLQAQVSAFGSLKSALSKFQDTLQGLKDASAFQARSATSSNDTVFTASATSAASAGAYSIEVTQLAQAHKLASANYTDSSTVVGEGTLTLSVGASAFSVTIDPTNSTLGGIRDAINNAADNTGVTATILNVSGGSKLVLTSNDTGASNALTVSVTGDTDGNDTDAAGLSALVYTGAVQNLSQVNAAQDATLNVDTFAVTSASNTVTGVINGVTLNLAAAAPGVPETLTVSADHDAAKTAVNDFVSAYNDLTNTMNSVSAYNASTGSAAALFGDSGLRSMEFQIRQDISNAVTGLTGPFSTLAEIGVTTDSSGKLQVDSAELEAALSSSFDDVGSLFGSTDGYAVRLDSKITEFLATDGIIDSRTDSLDSQLNVVQEQRDRLDLRLGRVEERYRRQFTALDSLLSQLQSTSDFLSQQLVNLPGGRSSS